MLTIYGLLAVTNTIPLGGLVVLFRNNHVSGFNSSIADGSYSVINID